MRQHQNYTTPEKRKLYGVLSLPTARATNVYLVGNFQGSENDLQLEELVGEVLEPKVERARVKGDERP